MSSDASPVLAGTIPAFELFMTAWECLAEKHGRLKLWIKISLEWATTYYSQMDNTKAYILSMGECRVSCACLMLIHHKVLNPCYRMSWIRQHWDEAYITKAEQIVKAMVSPELLLGSFFVTCTFTNMAIYQMVEYRERAKQRSAADTASSSSSGTDPIHPTPAYMSLAVQYSLDDMHFGGVDDAETQTLEQEYQAYVMSVSKPGTDMLTFWEVGHFPSGFYFIH